MRKESALETKKSQPEKKQLQEIPSDPEHLPHSPLSSSRVEEPTCSTFADVSLLSSEIGNVDFDTSETQENKIAEEPLSISATPLHEPTTITSKPSSSNEHQHQVISCPRLSWKYVKSTQRLLNCILSDQLPQHLILLSIVLSLNMGKSIILKGMKRKQKDTNLAHQSHFARRNLDQSDN